MIDEEDQTKIDWKEPAKTAHPPISKSRREHNSIQESEVRQNVRYRKERDNGNSTLSNKSMPIQINVLSPLKYGPIE